MYLDSISSIHIYTIVHLIGSSPCRCTGLFQDPRHTASRLALLICLSKIERSFEMQAFTMPLVGITRPPCFAGIHVMANILFHTKKCLNVAAPQDVVISFFSVLAVDLSVPLIATTQSLSLLPQKVPLQKDELKASVAELCQPPNSFYIFLQRS